MRIVIIGAGISGCSAYLALKKYLPKPPGKDHTYTIIEAYDTTDDTTLREGPPHGETHSSTLIVGGGLGVCPNGLGVLARLDDSLLQDVVRAGYPVSQFKMQSSYGWELFRGTAAGGVDPVMNTVSISRHALWKCLRDRIPDDVIVNKKAYDILPGGMSIVKCVGGTVFGADLVIGADGLKSTVRNSLFRESGGPGELYPPQYEYVLVLISLLQLICIFILTSDRGFVGVGGFAPATPDIKSHIEPGTMTFTLGGNGFFGYAFSSSSPKDPDRGSPSRIPEPGDTVMWWSTYSTATSPDPQTVDKDRISRRLRRRHHKWHDPVIQKIVNSSTVENIYPVWTTAELPTWERDGVVLVGDAAHTLPPNSGQGASQALEDVECLALFLAHYLQQAYRNPEYDAWKMDKVAVKLAIKKYMDLRFPRVKAIREEARRTQSRRKKMNIIQEFIMYFAIWLQGEFVCPFYTCLMFSL